MPLSSLWSRMQSHSHTSYFKYLGKISRNNTRLSFVIKHSENSRPCTPKLCNFQLANKDWMQILVLYWIDLKESAVTNNFCSLQWSFALSWGQVDYLLHFYISGFRAWLKQMVKQNRSDESVKIQIGMWRRGCYKDDFITATAEHWWKRFSAARVLFLELSLVTAYFV